MSNVAEMEPCPIGLRHKDHPRYGGNLFYHQELGVSGCVRCGWRGIPTHRGGIISTHCPVCNSDVEPQGRRNASTQSNKDNKRRKAARKARKKNRK